MSSNPFHITRSNYEEFFLLYIDGELSPEGCDAVEAFAAMHPDLQEELEILLTTKLDAEPVLFNKESLMADSMKSLTIDESLLLYIDDELKGKEKAAVEAQLQTDTTLQFQHQLLLQTKLDKAEAVIYPYKQELYRRSAPAIRPVYWFRAAAVVFAVAAMGYMWQMSQDLQAPPTVAVQKPATIEPAKSSAGTTPDNNSVAITQPSATEQTGETEQKDNNVENKVARAAREVRAVQQAAAVVTTAPVDVPDAGIAAVEIPADMNRVNRVNSPQQIINNPAVTTTTPVAYNPIETATNNSAVNDVAVTETNDKKGSVRGFLRKATRLIERRTGINPTNDDEELLIGAVAIKLK
jgi:anti-sigma factor RsiW